jgi:hypothetical protein
MVQKVTDVLYDPALTFRPRGLDAIDSPGLGRKAEHFMKKQLSLETFEFAQVGNPRG